MENQEGEASSHQGQGDATGGVAPIGVQVGARDIERLLAAIAQYVERQAGTPVNQNVGLLEKFKKLYPTEFEGTFKPQEAEDWLKTVERVLTAMGVTDEQKVTLATFTFKGQALIWWEASQRLLSAPLPDVQPPVPQVITWARFVKAFNDKYCPEMYRFAQEAKFINLKQGSMSVAEYDAKFNALSAYATDMVDTEEKKGRRFRKGLEDNVRTRITPYKEKDYADLVDMANKIGKDVEEMFEKREQTKKSKIAASQVRQASKSGGDYKVGSKFQHLKGQSDFKQQSGQGREVSKQSVNREGGSSGRGTFFQCFRCGSPDHRVRDCPEAGKGIKCYNCGEMGHMSTQCPKSRAPAASSVGNVPVGRGASSSSVVVVAE
ncbi:uncharacterized protein LOC131306791 [Rhododendron vialii]|uniref:uncharacterized protein LOC131306791 n=1 Tax=Rhododendron vialii TaxID=182163 RepID=UPI00265EC004|nr:uncharacterized protein LOC131306791 [Rhododendron vialii]